MEKLLLEDLRRRLGLAHEQIGEALASMRRVRDSMPNTTPAAPTLDSPDVHVDEEALQILHQRRIDEIARSNHPITRIITPPPIAGGDSDNVVRRHVGSGFKFGSKSQRELQGVHPILVDVATLALDYSTQDFMIFDGLRTEEEQRNHVRRGNSKTMHSKHLPQADGMSHAVDAVPVVGTIPKWEWDLVYPVVMAFDKAATELGHAHKIVWGGAWDRRLSDFGGDRAALYRKVVEDYAARNPGKDFLDGPHFELRL